LNPQLAKLDTPPPATDIRRLLVMRNDRLGDMVMTLPALEAAHQALPNARLTVLASEATAAILQGNPAVDEVLLDRPEQTARELGRRLARHRFDAALVIAANSRNAWGAWWARIPTRVCWAYGLTGFLLGEPRLFLHRSRPPVHESEFALAFVRRLGLHVPSRLPTPRLPVDMMLRSRIARKLQARLGVHRPLFAINPGSRQSSFNWPIEHYARLATRLAEHGRVVVTGHRSEKPLLDKMEQLVPPSKRPSVAFFSEFGLLELVAALDLADVLTVSSTGPMHLAGAVGTPVVALFSCHPAQSPSKWAPFGEGHTILVAPGEPGEIPVGPEHMTRIDVEDVITANLQAVNVMRRRLIA
jgi:lipopolysaccharide heptosyltransferase II